MIEELKKFPPNAKCYGYSGETCGLGIVYKEKYGFIPCSELDENDDNCKTEYLKKD